MSEISSDEAIWYPGSAYRRTDNSSESSESLESYSERTSLLPQAANHGKLDYKSTNIVAEEIQGTPEHEDEPLPDERPSQSVFAIIGLLLIGVFISNADGTLVLATYGTISSEFRAFGAASWLSTSFMLSSCAVQPLTGKLSDIYGRKPLVLLSYITFAIGCVICGIGQSFWHVVAGRIISGVGSSGMTVLVSIIITDLVPILQVASWRSYVNVVATMGRSIGGPLGGLLADTIGWRWSFVGQGPLTLLAIILVALKLPPSTGKAGLVLQQKGQPSRLRRIDFVGAFSIALTIVTLLGALSLGGQDFPWSHPYVVAPAIISVVSAGFFALWEIKYALEPVFPPSLLVQRDVATSYAVSALQLGAQSSMMYSVPLFFKATQNSSNTTAGSHLFPAVVGNAIGGLLAGLTIQKTGRYKNLTILATICSSASYLLLILHWHEDITLLKSLEIVPGGFGNGIAISSTFIGLTTQLKHSEMAIATSGFYLMSSIAMVIALAISSSVQMASLNSLLQRGLSGVPHARKIIDAVSSDVSTIAKLDEPIRKIVIGAYVRSLEYSHCVSLTASLLALLIALTIREHKLR